ncbi:MAG: phenylacetate--CoA ligase family protein [Alphaproteobacteria bacterium]
MPIHDERAERASREEIKALQWDRLARMLERARATNEFFRRHWRGARLESVTSFEAFAREIPTVEKADFVTDQAAHPPYGLRHAHALERREPMFIATTSGTSGQGVETRLQTAAEMDGMRECYRYMFRWAGLERGDLVFVTIPIAMLAGGQCEYLGAQGAGMTAVAIGNYDARRKLDLIHRYRPKALLGSTSYFGHLAAVATARPPAEGLTCLLAGTEGSGWAWLRRMEEEWAVPVHDRFGFTQAATDHMFTCERGIGERGRPGMLHNVEPLYLLEVIDPATGRHVKDGEKGRVVVTSLYHWDTHLVRCATGDEAVYREPGYCACGRPFAGIEIATMTRVDDVRKVKGVNLFPPAVEDAVFSEPAIEEYQVVLSSSAGGADVATARLMPKTALDPESAAGLARRMAESLRERTGIGFAVELVPPGTLARSEYKARRWKDERAHTRG